MAAQPDFMNEAAAPPPVVSKDTELTEEHETGADPSVVSSGKRTEAAPEIALNPHLAAKTVRLNDGRTIPMVGLGTFLKSRAMKYFRKEDDEISDEQREQDKKDDEKEEQEFANAVVVAIKNGYRHIDTAQAYRTEFVIGNALKPLFEDFTVLREEIFITSKIARSIHQPDEIRASIEKSLNDLQTDYIDLMLIHSPHSYNEEGKRGHDVVEKLLVSFPPHSDYNEICEKRKTCTHTKNRYKILHEYRKQGKIKSVGVSNFSVKHLEMLDKACPDLPLPAVNQIECTPFLQETEIIDYCNKKGILIESYSPVGQAKEEIRTNPVLTAIAQKHNKTWAQVMLRWQIQRGFVLLPKSVTPQRIIANGEIFDFELSEEDMTNLNDLKDKNIRVCWNPLNEPWDDIWPSRTRSSTRQMFMTLSLSFEKRDQNSKAWNMVRSTDTNETVYTTDDDWVEEQDERLETVEEAQVETSQDRVYSVQSVESNRAAAQIVDIPADTLETKTVRMNDGRSIPMVGLGTFLKSRAMKFYRKADEEISDEQREQDKKEDEKEEREFANAVVVAVKNGYRHIDTAQRMTFAIRGLVKYSVYRTEFVIGNAMKALFDDFTVLREEMFITSKVARTICKPEDIRRSIDKTLKDLQMEYVDLMLIHSPHSYNEEGKRGQDVIEKYRILHEYRKQGKIKSVGVSNFNVKHLEMLQKACPDLPLPAVNQIECTPFLQETEIIDYCNQKGILIESYSPVGQAKEEIRTNPVLTEIAQKHNKTWAQVMLRWQIQRGFVLLPKSVTPQRIIANGDIFDFELSEEDMASLNELKKENIRVCWNPLNEPWDEVQTTQDCMAERVQQDYEFEEETQNIISSLSAEELHQLKSTLDHETKQKNEAFNVEISTYLDGIINEKKTIDKLHSIIKQKDERIQMAKEISNKQTRLIHSLAEEKKAEQETHEQDEEEEVDQDLRRCLQVLTNLNNEIAFFEVNFNRVRVMEIGEENVDELVDPNSAFNITLDRYAQISQAINVCSENFKKSIVEIKQYIKEKYVPNTQDYKNWDLNDIALWIKSLENGRYIKYLDILIHGFHESEIHGSDLPDLTTADLSVTPFDIKRFRDKRDLVKHFKKLREEYSGNDDENGDEDEEEAEKAGSSSYLKWDHVGAQTMNARRDSEEIIDLPEGRKQFDEVIGDTHDNVKDVEQKQKQVIDKIQQMNHKLDEIEQSIHRLNANK